MALDMVVDSAELNAGLTMIGDAIREKAGGKEVLMFPDELAAGVSEVYDAGKQAEYDEFWNMIQQNGNRTAYINAFMDWGWEYIRPKYKIIPTADYVTNMFAFNVNLKKAESQYVDLSKRTNMSDTNEAAGNYQVFIGCTALEEVEDIGMQAGYYYRTWRNCPALHTIAVVRFNSATMIYDMFGNCTSLRNLIVAGTIGQNGFNVQSCPLTHDSLISIINALETKTSGTWTVTLGTTNLAKLSDAEKLFATQKGWTLA